MSTFFANNNKEKPTFVPQIHKSERMAKGKGRRLTDEERLNNLEVLERPGAPSLTQVSCDHDVSVGSIWNLKKQQK